MDEQTFTKKLLESEQMLYRIACGLLRSETDRQDAMQETALKAWTHRKSLREERYFKTWITRILINECHSLCRKIAREIPIEEVPNSSPTDHDATEIRLMLESLPTKQRIPMVLHYMEGFSLEEIARTQRIPVGLVKSRMFQARKRLRVEMSEEEGTK